MEDLGEVSVGNAVIQTTYAVGLLLLSHKQKQPKREDTIEKLRKLVERNTGNDGIKNIYIRIMETV